MPFGSAATWLGDKFLESQFESTPIINDDVDTAAATTIDTITYVAKNGFEKVSGVIGNIFVFEDIYKASDRVQYDVDDAISKLFSQEMKSLKKENVIAKYHLIRDDVEELVLNEDIVVVYYGWYDSLSTQIYDVYVYDNEKIESMRQKLLDEEERLNINW